MKKRLSAGLLVGVAFMALGAWGGTTGPEDTPISDERGMVVGAPAPASLGAMTFSPDGTLFVGDGYGATIYAIDIEDSREGPDVRLPEVEELDRRVASLLGTTAARVRIHDMAVHPETDNLFFTVSRGPGAHEFESNKSGRPQGGTPHLIRMTPSGELTEVVLEDIAFAGHPIPNALPESARTRSGDTRRLWSVVELGFSDGTLYASGVSNEEFSSTMLQIPFPFTEAKSNSIRIFHTAHGRWETDAPARVFTPYMRDGETRIFAGFSCTPLVDFGFVEAEDGTLVEGKTVAELGAGNHVLDMITVEKSGEDYVLLANHLHPFAMLPLSPVPEADKLTRPMNRAGIEREFMPEHKGVVRLANFGHDRVVTLQRPDGRDGRVDLRTFEVAELPMG